MNNPLRNQSLRAAGPLLIATVAIFASACQDKPAAAEQPTAAATSSATSAAKVVAVTVGADGFQPSAVTLTKGQPATLRFTRTSDDTCAKKVVFPDISVERDLPLNQAVDVEVPTGEARELTFQCGMGMYKSKVVISG